jgi:hypothetical protein
MRRRNKNFNYENLEVRKLMAANIFYGGGEILKWTS